MAQNRIRSQCSPAGSATELGPLGRQADGVQHALRQHAVRFGVDADRAHLGAAAHHGAAEALAVRQAADHAVGPARFALVALQNRDRRQAELTERLPRAVAHGDELVAPLGHRARDQRLLLGQRRQLGRVVVQFGRRHRRGHDARQQRARHARLLLICSCILSALARISGVISKCPPNSFR